MWKATGVCVFIGWGFGLMSLFMAGELYGLSPYGLFLMMVRGLGMGLFIGLIGSMVAWSKRKTKDYTAAYVTSAVIGGLIVFGNIYGELNP